ncbi:alpha/beta hydrolase fold domain-containing protein [Noviherbaspirillum aridicola]|uniref:Alpha/beta hydrolase fold-3 domain-containing protein n=1 Tax=Noviherbaspirillum aridicola TaxID=2849687 RepID=A0ABQ4PZ38_9BURK|nr:alpha/beta hydrolase fold domain-containing protein [Noviherbaspirillum aridicola]GIZ50142.1 hypothetical protein NCCP691_01560 [Noviherbaspirillum aridicola]
MRANPETIPAAANEGELQLLCPAQGGSLPLRIYRGPRSRAHPALVYLHGGDFASGSQDDATAIARALSDTATVVTVGYPLAPASVFPHTLEACFPVLAWVAEHAKALRIDPMRLYIGGEQAGGALAASLAMIARDRLFDRAKTRRLAGQVLISPLLDPAQATPSLREAGDHPARQAWASYIVRPGDFNHPYASPLRSRRLAGMPPCLLLTAHDDPLRDEAKLYGRGLQSAGVPVQLQHLASSAVTGAGRTALVQARAERIRDFLSGKTA